MFGKQMSGRLFSQNAFPRAKGILNHSTPPQVTELVTGTLSTCCSIQPGGRRNYFDPLWGMSSFTVESQLRFMAGEEMLVHPLCGKAEAQSGPQWHIKPNYRKFGGFNVVLTSKPQRESRGNRASVTSYYCWEMTLYFTNMTECRDTGQNRL